MLGIIVFTQCSIAKLSQRLTCYYLLKSNVQHTTETLNTRNNSFFDSLLLKLRSTVHRFTHLLIKLLFSYIRILSRTFYVALCEIIISFYL